MRCFLCGLCLSVSVCLCRCVSLFVTLSVSPAISLCLADQVLLFLSRSSLVPVPLAAARLPSLFSSSERAAPKYHRRLPLARQQHLSVSYAEGNAVERNSLNKRDRERKTVCLSFSFTLGVAASSGPSLLSVG